MRKRRPRKRIINPISAAIAFAMVAYAGIAITVDQLTFRTLTAKFNYMTGDCYRVNPLQDKFKCDVQVHTDRGTLTINDLKQTIHARNNLESGKEYGFFVRGRGHTGRPVIWRIRSIPTATFKERFEALGPQSVLPPTR